MKRLIRSNSLLKNYLHFTSYNTDFRRSTQITGTVFNATPLSKHSTIFGHAHKSLQSHKESVTEPIQYYLNFSTTTKLPLSMPFFPSTPCLFGAFSHPMMIEPQPN